MAESNPKSNICKGIRITPSQFSKKYKHDHKLRNTYRNTYQLLGEYDKRGPVSCLRSFKDYVQSRVGAKPLVHVCFHVAVYTLHVKVELHNVRIQ